MNVAEAITVRSLNTKIVTAAGTLPVSVDVTTEPVDYSSFEFIRAGMSSHKLAIDIGYGRGSVDLGASISSAVIPTQTVANVGQYTYELFVAGFQYSPYSNLTILGETGQFNIDLKSKYLPLQAYNFYAHIRAETALGSKLINVTGVSTTRTGGKRPTETYDMFSGLTYKFNPTLAVVQDIHLVEGTPTSVRVNSKRWFMLGFALVISI